MTLPLSSAPKNWIIFVLPAIILGNLLWFRMVAIVRSRGFQVPLLWGGHFIVLRRFHEILRHEPNPRRRLGYRLLLAGVYAAIASVLYWMITTALAAAA